MFLRDDQKALFGPALITLTTASLLLLSIGSASAHSAGDGGEYLTGPWPYHMALVFVGYVTMLSGALTARYMKARRWWLKAHKLLGVTGGSIVLAAALTGVYVVASTTGDHLALPHAYLGAITALVVVQTPILGLAQFRYKSPEIRRAHRWSGRTALGLVAVNGFLGLGLVGLI